MELVKNRKIKIIQILNFEEDNAICNLLIFNNVNILLDCGIPSNFSIEKYKNYNNYLKNLKIILISRPDLKYCGALNFIINTYKISEIYCASPTKYLLEEILNNLNCFYNLDKNILENHYNNMNSITEIKFKETTKIKIDTNIKIKIKFYEMGDQIGSSLIKLNINKYKIVYLVNPLIENQKYIKKFDFNYIENIKIDCLILGHNKVKNVVNSINNLIETEFKLNLNKRNNNFCFVSDNITNLFKIFVELILFLRDYKEIISFKIYIPFNLKNFIEILKSLTEYMSENVNYDFYEENQFLISEVKYFKEINNNREFRNSIYICLYEDIIYGLNKKLLNFQNHFQFIFYGDVSIFKEDYSNLKKELETKKTNLNFNYNFEFKENISKNENSTIVSENFSLSKKTKNDNILSDNSIKENKLINQNLFFIQNEYFNFNIIKEEKEIDEYGEIINFEELDFFKKMFNNNNNKIKINYKEDFKRNYKNYTKELLNFYKKLDYSERINYNVLDNFKKYHFPQNSNIYNIIKLLKLLNFNSLILLKNNKNSNELIKKYYSKFIVENNELISNDNNLDVKILNKNIESNFKNIFIKNNFNLNIINLNFKIKKENFLEKNYKEIILKENKNNSNFNYVEEINDKKIILKEFDILKLQEYLLENNIETELNFSVLNYKDILYIKLKSKSILIESCFNKEYLEIRKLIYNFIKII